MEIRVVFITWRLARGGGGRGEGNGLKTRRGVEKRGQVEARGNTYRKWEEY